MTEEQKHAFDNLYCVSKVPVVLMDGEGKSICAFPDRFMDVYTEDFSRMLQEKLSECRWPEDTLFYCLSDEYYLGVVRLDEEVYLCTAIVNPVDQMRIEHDLYVELGIVPDKAADYFRWISTLPPMEYNQLGSICGLYKQIYSGTPTNHVNFIYNSSPLTAKQYSAEEQSLDEELATKRYAKGYVRGDLLEGEGDEQAGDGGDFNQKVFLSFIENERYLSEAIREGDVAKFLRILGEPARNFTLFSQPQVKNEFIGLAYLFSRSAISGGGPIKLCLELYDYYCRQVDTCTHLGEIYVLLRRMGRRFCEVVVKYKSKDSFSSYTKLCVNYINENLMEKITISSLEDAASLNRRSLSAYFKRDTGMGIAEYIQKQRLDEACYFLACTSFSLSQISEMFMFSSQSYFGKRFKNEYGKTPQEYRNEHNHK